MKSSFKNIITLFVFVLCINFQAKSQVTFTSWVHAPYITLYAAAIGAGVSTSSGITIDDQYSGTISTGFTFNFYGTPHTKCLIGANGNICFDTTQALGYDPWPITSVLLGNAELYNNICGPFCDMDVVFGGDVTYFVDSVAPNRIFGANYCHNAMYSSSSCPGQTTTTQILLYETSNNIEVHTAHKSTCNAWNGGYAIIGVQNATGTAATAAPGRNYPDTFNLSNEAWRFSPMPGDSSYSVSSIPFAPIPYYTIYWYDSATSAFLGTGDSIVLHPSAVTTYTAYAIGCNDSLSSGYDTPAVGHMTLMPLSVTGGIVPLSKEFSIYPNPAQNEVFIVSSEIIKSVVLTNLVGQILFGTTCSTNKVQIDINNLPRGMYYIKINDAISKKFLKE